jgi:hypothetical protein
MRAELRVPVELHKDALAIGIDHAECVHAEALHHAVAARDRAVRHDPLLHMGGLRHQRHEIPEGVVRAGSLRHCVMRLGFDGMNEVGKLHRVLDEEHRDVVADEIPIALVGIELHGETAHVARGVGRAALAGHGREAHEHRRPLALFRKQRRPRDFGQRCVALEESMRTGTARVDDALGNALMVEVRDLLAQDEIFEQCGAAQSRLE